jgi:hypothetical protein
LQAPKGFETAGQPLTLSQKEFFTGPQRLTVIKKEFFGEGQRRLLSQKVFFTQPQRPQGMAKCIKIASQRRFSPFGGKGNENPQRA